MEREPNRFTDSVVFIVTSLGIALAVNQAFFMNLFGTSLLNKMYIYLVLATFLSLVFILRPAHPNRIKKPPAWYDWLLFTVSIITNGYLASNAESIMTQGWEYFAPHIAFALSILLWLLTFDAYIRIAGLIVTAIALVLPTYPVVAGQLLLTILQCVQSDFRTTAQAHVLGVESSVGLPLPAAAG